MKSFQMLSRSIFFRVTGVRQQNASCLQGLAIK
jgi:hypothetical protein